MKVSRIQVRLYHAHPEVARTACRKHIELCRQAVPPPVERREREPSDLRRVFAGPDVDQVRMEQDEKVLGRFQIGAIPLPEPCRRAELDDAPPIPRPRP